MNEPELSEDLKALRTSSTRDLPTLEQVVSQVRTRRLFASAAWKGDFMFAIRTLKHRPLLATAAVVAATLLLMVLPVSFQQTTANDVALTLTGASIAQPQLLEVAQQLKAALRAEGVTVTAHDEGAPTYVLSATAPERSGPRVASLARSFAGSLAARGYSASVEVTAKKERVLGTVYAYALDRVISISTDGKSAAQLEAEIRQRLTEAGVSDASVSVTDEPGGGQKVAIEVNRRHVGDPSSGILEEPLPEIQLTKNGAPLEGDACTVKVKKMKNESGMTLTVEVRDAGRTGLAEVRGGDSMSDADLAAAIDAQLRQAGLNVRVTVTGGEIKVERAQ